MTTSTLQIRVDSDLRHDADELFARAGLDLSSAVRLFLKQSVLRQRLPFEVIAVNPDPFFSEANQRVTNRPFTGSVTTRSLSVR